MELRNLSLILGILVASLYGCSSDDDSKGTGGAGGAGGAATGGSGGTGGGGGTEAACTKAGGTVATAPCCKSAGDFPNQCAVGSCGCAPAESHDVKVCNCPAGSCFDGTDCVAAGGAGGAAGGGGTAGAGGDAAECVKSGGTVTTKLCCKTAGDFPDTCTVGSCGCAPADSENVQACECPTGKCWDGTTCK